MRLQMLHTSTRWLAIAVAAVVVAGAALLALPETTQAAALTATRLMDDSGMSGPGTAWPRPQARQDRQAPDPDTDGPQTPEGRSAPQEDVDLKEARQAFDAYVAQHLRAAYAQIVQDAVDAGIVTQEQADLFTQEPGHGWMKPAADDDDAPAGDAPGGMRMAPQDRRHGSMRSESSDDDAPAGDAPGGMRMAPHHRHHGPMNQSSDGEDEPIDEAPGDMRMPRGDRQR